MPVPLLLFDGVAVLLFGGGVAPKLLVGALLLGGGVAPILPAGGGGDWVLVGAATVLGVVFNKFQSDKYWEQLGCEDNGAC